MKKLIVLLAAGLISTSSFANKNPFSSTADASFATFAKIACKDMGGEWGGFVCFVSSTMAGGISITVSTLAGLIALKEEVHNVEADSYDYIAGGPMTLALGEVVENARKTGPEVNELSDKEIIALLLTTI